MDQSLKRLMLNDHLTPRDVGRLLVAMRVEIHNGRKGLPKEVFERLIKAANASPEFDEYKLYLMVDGVLEEARDLYEGTLRQAYLACAGLRMFDEALSFANTTTPKKRWDKYTLGKISDATLENGRWLWRNLRNTVKSLAAVKGALRVVGEWLEVPGLVTMLPGDIPLQKEVNSLNRYASKTLDKLYTNDPADKQFEEVRGILLPISYEDSQPTEVELDKAREKFRTFDLRMFYSTLEDAIDLLNQYEDEPLPGRK